MRADDRPTPLPSRSTGLLLALACAAGVALGAPPRPPAEAVVRGALDIVPADDPFPIRRVRGADARLPDLLKELEPGPVVRLPRVEFEARVRAAGRAVGRAKHGARVTDATYTAELDGGDLTGTAELGVLNANGLDHFLPLDPLRVAVRGAKWAGGGDAVLAVPPGASAPAVWVTGDGRKALQFRWSLAGTTEPGERRFELRVPACASSALELDLPADQAPTAAADVLLTGPFDAPGKPARKLWKFRFGGRSKLEFAVRAGGAPAVGATAALVAKYELGSGQLTAAFEYELRPARGSVGEWTFLADPGLRVTEVVANNRAGWTVEPPTVPNGPRLVRVRLRQPGPGGKVLVSAVAPFPDPARPADAPLPAVRPVGAVSESELLELRLAPGVKIDSWAPGDYHLADATAAPDLARTLFLSGALSAPGTDEPFRRMPSVRASFPECEFATFERLEWVPGPTSSLLVARVRVRVARGPLFQLVVRPPNNLTLDRGAAVTDELVAHIGAPSGAGQVVELARPLLTGQQAELRFEFRGPGVRPGDPVPFPAFAVAAAAERDGWLGVAPARPWAARVQPGAGAAPAGLWGWLATDAPADARAVYFYRAKEPDGFVTLAGARPRVGATAVVAVDRSGDRWAATTRFALSATGGPVDGATVFVPGPRDERTWKLVDPANALLGATPVPPPLVELPLFGPADLGAALVGACRRAGAADGTFWALRFARPIGQGAVLETVAPGPALGTTEFALPVPRLVGTEQQTRAEVAPGGGRATARLDGDEVRVLAPGAAAGGAPHVSDAYLLTAVRGPNEVLAAFGGLVRDSDGGALPVGLPPGAEVRGVCVGGRWLAPSACAPDPAGGPLRVPVPAGPAVRFEVRYRLAPGPGWPTRRVSSPVPAVPGDPPVNRWWSFADGVLPGWPSRPWNATPDEPPLLGGPLASGPPALVTRSDDEWVRVGTVRAADALAVVLVALLVAFGLVAARRGPRGAVALACVTGAALVAAELGPPWWARAAWPVLCAAVVALARVLLGVRLRRARTAVAAALLGALALGSLPLTAQQQPPTTVLVVAARDGGEEIVAPQPLLDRLDALARPPAPAPVVAAATYDVRADEAGARVTARFVVHAFRAGENTLSLPLADARLERATVNGAPAFPAAVRPDLYAVPLGGPGRYEVEVRFAATVTASGPERDLRFGAPESADAKLTASLPGAARQPQLVGRFGRQTVSPGGERTTLEVDLGPAKQVHLRWREGGGGAAVVRVREACVWDVTDGGAELTAAYLVRVEQGSVANLRFDVPSELEVLRVAVRAPDALAPAPALKDWQLAPEKGGTRALRIDLQAPANGRFLVLLECAPRKPVTRQPVLRFPRAAFGTGKGEPSAAYALRTARITADEIGTAGVSGPADDVLREFASVPDLKLDPNHLPRSFRPVPGAVAELRPVVRTSDPPSVRTVTSWAVGPRGAEGTGTLSWTAGAPVALVEFGLGGVKVLEVRGPGVAGWGQSGGRVQVWLRAGAKEGALEWIGTLAPGGKPGAEPFAFDPAAPAPHGARLVSAEVRVRPVAGWAVRADRTRGWQSAAAPAGELRVRTAAAQAPALRMQVEPER